MFYVKGDQVENRWTPLSHGAGEIKTKPSSRQVIEAKVVLHDRAVRVPLALGGRTPVHEPMNEVNAEGQRRASTFGRDLFPQAETFVSLSLSIYLRAQRRQANSPSRQRISDPNREHPLLHPRKKKKKKIRRLPRRGQPFTTTAERLGSSRHCPVPPADAHKPSSLRFLYFPFIANAR